jgi:hypothetical protein
MRENEVHLHHLIVVKRSRDVLDGIHVVVAREVERVGVRQGRGRKERHKGTVVVDVSIAEHLKRVAETRCPCLAEPNTKDLSKRGVGLMALHSNAYN